MGFLEETSNMLGIDENTLNSTFCYACPDKGVVVEGYKKIYELSQTKITLLCEHGKQINIVGTDLEIKEISHREINIKGIISAIEFL